MIIFELTFEYVPVTVELACRTLVVPPPHIHVMARALPWGVTDVMCRYDAPLVGSVADRNSCQLDWPSPSASTSGAAMRLPTPPKYCICHCCHAVSGVTLTLVNVAVASWFELSDVTTSPASTIVLSPLTICVAPICVQLVPSRE